MDNNVIVFLFVVIIASIVVLSLKVHLHHEIENEKQRLTSKSSLTKDDVRELRIDLDELTFKYDQLVRSLGLESVSDELKYLPVLRPMDTK